MQQAQLPKNDRLTSYVALSHGTGTVTAVPDFVGSPERFSFAQEFAWLKKLLPSHQVLPQAGEELFGAGVWLLTHPTPS